MQDVVAELRVGVKDLAAEDRGGWAGAALSDRVQGLLEVSEALQVELVRALAGWDRLDAWGDDGAVTAVSWITHRFPITAGEAAGLVRLARLHASHPVVAEAMDRGDLPIAHARRLARAERHREVAFAECVAGLVGLVAETCSLKDYAQVIGEWEELVDDQAPDDPTRNRVTCSEVGDRGRMVLDTTAEELAIIRAAIAAEDTPDPVDCPEGPRSREQRWHDIAIDIFNRSLADRLGNDPSSTGGVEVVVDADVAVELLAEPDDDALSIDTGERDLMAELLAPYRRDTGPEQFLRRRRCTYADGRSARQIVAAVLLCSGWVRRIVRDPRTGTPLDVGRAHRRFTPRQVRALVIRDGGCAFPGCDREPRWCDAHHLKPWEHLGPTDLDNGCLLCRRHHTLVHHKGWRLERDSTTGVFTATGPDGRQFTRRPGERC